MEPQFNKINLWLMCKTKSWLEKNTYKEKRNLFSLIKCCQHDAKKMSIYVMKFKI